MHSVVELPIEEGNLKTIVNNAYQYALSNGLVMGSNELPDQAVSFSPFCLFPSSFSQFWFKYAKEIQTKINLLIHKVAYDQEFIETTLKRTVESDEFTRKLFQIYHQVNQEGLSQDISLGLLRTDYMLNVNQKGMDLKQVEINTVASSFGGLITKLHGLHSYILNQQEVDLSNFPETMADQKLADGLISARKAYGKEKTVILFLIEEKVNNFCDQRALEYLILRVDPSLRVIRATFQEIGEHGTIRNKCLFFFGQEVAVVYFRTGYDPEQYASEKDWDVRLMIERSRAIKCPTVAYQLAGTKKIQQELSSAGVLERFLSNKEDVKKIRDVFAKQYPLDLNENGDEAVKLALKHPDKYVMKPQREGGGNNIYGEDIKIALNKIGGSKEREGFILMELIKPPPIQNYILKPGKDAQLCSVFGELGIYGVILGDSQKIIENYESGHMMRSKIQGTNEGGVAAGYGVLDLPILQ